MTKLMLVYTVVAISVFLGLGYLRILAGDPQAVWFFCELLRVCK